MYLLDEQSSIIDDILNGRSPDLNSSGQIRLQHFRRCPKRWLHVVIQSMEEVSTADQQLLSSIRINLNFGGCLYQTVKSTARNINSFISYVQKKKWFLASKTEDLFTLNKTGLTYQDCAARTKPSSSAPLKFLVILANSSMSTSLAILLLARIFVV